MPKDIKDLTFILNFFDKMMIYRLAQNVPPLEHCTEILKKAIITQVKFIERSFVKRKF